MLFPNLNARFSFCVIFPNPDSQAHLWSPSSWFPSVVLVLGFTQSQAMRCRSLWHKGGTLASGSCTDRAISCGPPGVSNANDSLNAAAGSSTILIHVFCTFLVGDLLATNFSMSFSSGLALEKIFVHSCEARFGHGPSCLGMPRP